MLDHDLPKWNMLPIVHKTLGSAGGNFTPDLFMILADEQEKVARLLISNS